MKTERLTDITLLCIIYLVSALAKQCVRMINIFVSRAILFMSSKANYHITF